MDQPFFYKKNNFIRQLLFLFLFFSNLIASPAYAEQLHPLEEQNNFAGFFLGGTKIENKQYFTYALEYYRTIMFPFGVSIEYESVPNNLEGRAEYEFFSVGVIHFPNKIYVGAGPGVKFVKEQSSKLLGRLSIGYILSLPYEMEFIPNINYDAVSGQASELVYGISIGKRF